MSKPQEVSYQNNMTSDTEILLKDNVKYRLSSRGYTIDIIEQPKGSDGGWLAPLNLRFAGVPKHISLSDCDIEIEDSHLGFSIDETVKNVLKTNKDKVDFISHYWPVYTYTKNAKAVYAINNELLPLNSGYFAGFIFAEHCNYELDSRGLERIKSAQYAKEHLGNALVRLERWVDGQFVGVILKKDGQAVKESWFVNKEKVHLNSTIENLLARALNELSLT